MHTPVLLNQVLEALDVQNGRLYIDATLGEGGHVKEIARKGGKVMAIDRDPEQIRAFENQERLENIILVQGNYSDIERIANQYQFFPVDGVLFDLGLSMAQLTTSNRGFSYKQLDNPLDMRLGEDVDQTAADLLNSLNENELYDLLAKYSEDLDSKVIAQTIVKRKRSLETVADLVETVKEALTVCSQHHQHDLNRTLSRVFQALRIAVNNEFEHIRKGLQGALNILKKDGKVVVITFHSLEDRVVKQFIRSNNLRSRAVIKGSPARAYERSAQLRVITKSI